MIAGCAGRLRVAFDLLPRQSGSVLSVAVYLHATQIACLWGFSPPLDLTAAVPVRVEIPLDKADICPTPVTATSMDVIVNGSVETASRQEFNVHYLFVP
jgi:hypothetical protein